MTYAVNFADLPGADLQVEGIYRGGTKGDISSDPLARLLPVGNLGGFRYKAASNRQRGGRLQLADVAIMALKMENHPDWPDTLDESSGRLWYFGDQRHPGSDLHHTSRGGNGFLRDTFHALHSDPPRREEIPPFFLFKPTGEGRDLKFVGVAVPGGSELDADSDLVAVWRRTPKGRFQNYRAIFTVLDIATAKRGWIDGLLAGHRLGPETPKPFRRWVERGTYAALKAPPNATIRTQQEQEPATREGKEIIAAIVRHFAPKPTAFEALAGEIWRWMNPSIADMTFTRAQVDGGRDAYGEILIGPVDDPVSLKFALEAKCYAKGGVGVKGVSRLISRIKHREFGVLVTTTYLHSQAYKEIREDQHPIAVVAGADIVDILSRKGRTRSVADLKAWLRAEYPVDPVRM